MIPEIIKEKRNDKIAHFRFIKEYDKYCLYECIVDGKRNI